MKGDCAIGNENQRDNELYVLCMNGKCLHVWVKDRNMGHKYSKYQLSRMALLVLY